MVGRFWRCGRHCAYTSLLTTQHAHSMCILATSWLMMLKTISLIPNHNHSRGSRRCCTRVVLRHHVFLRQFPIAHTTPSRARRGVRRARKLPDREARARTIVEGHALRVATEHEAWISRHLVSGMQPRRYIVCLRRLGHDCGDRSLELLV